MALRSDLRTVAIVAHVDHGKTTLVDAMLRQSGALGRSMEGETRVMDSGDIEKERGITILAKHTVFTYQGTKITLVDTPGHADFGGEVERGLALVDGVLLLVDAAEGPLPQTRFVLRKALEAGLPVVLVVNKIDRSDARPDEVVHEAEELFLELGAEDEQLDFPTVFAIAREGKAGTDHTALEDDLGPVMQALLDTIPAPEYEEGHPLQAQVGNLDASPYLGRLGVVRVRQGEISKGQTVAWARTDGSIQNAKITDLFVTEGLERVPADKVGPGEIAAVAGFPDIMLGETLTSPEDPRPLPLIEVDEPSLAMTIGVNTSPLAGRDGDKLTARMIENRLNEELLGNVSLRVSPTERPDTWEVAGRGELQLAVLVETMRREGFELTVGKPHVLTKEVDGKRMEPREALTIDIPEEHMGVVQTLLAERRGELTNMVGHGTGWLRLEYGIPARGLIGIRDKFMTQTRGTGMLHHVFDGWMPWAGVIKSRHNGSLISDRSGVITPFSVLALQERGTMFMGPGEDVYEGCIIGSNSRIEDLDVNIVREKKQTNIRSAGADELVRLTPPARKTLDEALEFIGDDEQVEVTPNFVRLRKRALSATDRQKEARKKARGEA
ncbi:MAG: translational GTPase TypA [Solirubrobacteraceae bacterium]|nr:translational GTPase TypA [Solirubrobacteraceae bacterium]